MYVNKINFNPSLESYLLGSIRKKVSVNSKEEQIGKSIFYLLIEQRRLCKGILRRNYL